MSRIVDFRHTSVFSLDRIDRCGSSVGRIVYPKLYALENLFRILVHSILSVQIGPGWWSIAVDSRIQKKVAGYQGMYSLSPWHTNPGGHEIYYTDIGDMLEIARANAHLLIPVIPDMNRWIAQIETIRLPRNVTAHMNFPNAHDKKRIEVIYKDIKTLFVFLNTNSTVPLLIP